jgi:hypothetical protein
LLERVCLALIALLAHVLLVVTVWYLYPFLQGGREPAEVVADPHWWWIDLLLIVQFGIPHSLLLRPGMRKRLERVVPSAIYGCCFTIVTCSSLLLLVLVWRVHPVVCVRLDGWARVGMQTAYVLSWVGLLYTLSLTGYGYQTGWSPFWGWFRQGRVPRRQFEVKGAYHRLRHPVYLAFLGQVWFTPLMTVDRLLLTLLLTGYIFLGSYFKDRRLEYYLGETYRKYQAQVPGYPFFPGPLGRVSPPKEVALQHGR